MRLRNRLLESRRRAGQSDRDVLTVQGPLSGSRPTRVRTRGLFLHTARSYSDTRFCVLCVSSVLSMCVLLMGCSAVQLWLWPRHTNHGATFLPQILTPFPAFLNPSVRDQYSH